MVIGDLGENLARLPTLARWHFDQWGPLTGATTLEDYVALLTVAARSRTVPSVLVAVDGKSCSAQPISWPPISLHGPS